MQVIRNQDNRNLWIKHISHKETSVAKFKSAHPFPSNFYNKIDNPEYIYLFYYMGCYSLSDVLKKQRFIQYCNFELVNNGSLRNFIFYI